MQKKGMTCFGCHEKGHNLKECTKIPKKDKNTICVKTIVTQGLSEDNSSSCPTGGSDEGVRVQKKSMTCFRCHEKGYNFKECMKIPKNDKNVIFAKNTEDWKRADGSEYRASPKKGVVSVEVSTAKDTEHEEGGVEPWVKIIVTQGLSEDNSSSYPTFLVRDKEPYVKTIVSQGLNEDNERWADVNTKSLLAIYIYICV